MGFLHAEWLDVGGSVAVGLLSGYMVLQYSDVRSAYAPAVTGRAMVNTAMARPVTAGAGHGGVHHGAVPGRGADAVGDGRGGLPRRRTGCRPVRGGDADHCGHAGGGRTGFQVPAGASALTRVREAPAHQHWGGPGVRFVTQPLSGRPASFIH
eukprot:gene219-315_t